MKFSVAYYGMGFGALVVKANKMKKLTTILILLFITSISQAQNNPTGQWELTILSGTVKPLKEIFVTKIPMLNIDTKQSKFAGTNGCNQIHGRLHINKTYFRFDSKMASTMMACPGRGEQYFNALLFDINRYEIHQHELIFYRDEKELMRFRRIK
jgi:heat shock protein HslJ